MFVSLFPCQSHKLFDSKIEILAVFVVVHFAYHAAANYNFLNDLRQIAL